jgi:hypothetical protein
VVPTRHGLGDLIGSLNYWSHAQEREAYFLGARDGLISVLSAGLNGRDSLADAADGDGDLVRDGESYGLLP